MSKPKKLKYDFQRVEQKRKNGISKKSQKERKQMEMSAKKHMVSIGTFTFFAPKPDSMVGTFTLAFDKPLAKSEVYAILVQMFNGNLREETTKSVKVELERPIPFKVIRERVRQDFSKIL